jgi:hypothetical protein
MPYKVFADGEKFCVHKLNADNSPGDVIPGGCHASKSDASAHMRALYANEAKEMTDATLDLLKEIAGDADRDKPERASSVLDEWKSRIALIPEEEIETPVIDGTLNYIQVLPLQPLPESIITTSNSSGITYINGAEIPNEKAVEQPEDNGEEKAKRSDVSAADRARATSEYGNVTYADETNKKYPLDNLRHAQAAARYFGMERNYSKYSPEERKKIQAKIDAALKKFSGAKKDLLGKLKEVGDYILSWFKDEPEDETGLSIWKEGNVYWWLARYSNKYRDNDNPPEIISSESHKRFEKLVKEGKAPLPELWAWHNKNWKVGKSNGVAYDELGFAVALGTFDKGKEEVAEALMKSKESIKVSHGMPISTIKRDEVDPTIIVEHETREISFLPAWAAANKLTGFVVLESKEESMAIPDETKQEWISKLGIKPETLESLETANAEDAAKAVTEGLESKETEVAQPATQPVLTPEIKEISTDELISAVKEAINGIVAPLAERINALELSLKEVKEISDKREEALKGTPTASLQALLGQFAQTAIGKDETRVDGRTSLAQSKPKETAANGGGRTVVPFINDLLDGK